MPRVFISHSSQDHELVEREIIATLRAHGVETWYSTDNIKSASEWERQIRTGLKESDWFLIALSPRSVASEWVRREVHWAFLKRKERIIPVMLETCEPDELHLGLLPLQFIDFRHDVAEARERLLAVWGLDKAAQVETHYHAAREALAVEDWNTAVEHLEAVLRLDPAHIQAEAELNHARRHQGLAALYDKGLTHLREKRWREALATLRQVRTIDGNYKDVSDSVALADAELRREEAERLYHEALGAAEREEWAAAVEQLAAVLKLNPSHAAAQAALNRAGQQRELAELYTAGREHLQAGRWREALKSFRRVRAIDKNYRGVADLIAEADAGLEGEEVLRPERERQEREAKEEAERKGGEKAKSVHKIIGAWIDEEPTPDADSTRRKLFKVLAILVGVLLLFILAYALWPKKDPSRVANSNAPADKQPVISAADFYKRAEALRKQDKYAEAEAEYRNAVTLEPNNADYHNELGNVLDSQHKYVEAESECRKAIVLDPNKADYHNNLGDALYHQDKNKEAEAEYRKAIDLDPDNALYHKNLGDTLDNQDKNKEAQAEWRKAELGYRKAIESNPNEAASYNGLGAALNNQNKYTEAEAEHRKAIALQPNNADYHTGLGNALYNQNKDKEAEAEYRKAIDLDPNNARSHDYLGDALDDQKRNQEGRVEHRKAKELKSKSR